MDYDLLDMSSRTKRFVVLKDDEKDIRLPAVVQRELVVLVLVELVHEIVE